jgi:hypothetical protein
MVLTPQVRGQSVPLPIVRFIVRVYEYRSPSFVFLYKAPSRILQLDNWPLLPVGASSPYLRIYMHSGIN